MTKRQYKNLNDSIESFELIKSLSEEKWESIEHFSTKDGKKIKGLKWRKGLNDYEIEDFENKLGFKFPNSLKNFYKVMNGLEISDEDFNINDEYAFYQNLFRTYPEDIYLIKENIDHKLKIFNILNEDIESKKVPMIFNYCSNRYLIFDENYQVLSIRNDAIFFAENLSKGLSKDIFHKYMDTKNEHLNKYKYVNGWLVKKYWS